MFTFGRQTGLEERAVRETARVLFRNRYAASLVTNDRAASLACDPTIFISCQS